MKRLTAIVLFILLIQQFAFSQKETYNWNFGYGGALTFNTPDLEPEFVNDSKLSSWEGCATISDKDGKLLFYAHGNTVWNKNNVVMDNGNGLMGHSSATQSCVAFRCPNEIYKYYIFTVDGVESNTNGFNYSIVDMSLNNGLGKVVEKNVKIHPKPVERLTVIPHVNKTDYWVIVHLWQNNEYLAYHVSETGVNPTPVVSTGTYKANRATGSVMKPSLDGKILASAHSFAKVIEIFDFDDYSGKLTLKHNLLHSYFDWPYGVEFSPDNKILYAALCTPGRLVQFDLTKETSNEIVNSMTVLGYRGGNFYYGSLQLGPNGKIYVAQDGHNYLGVINRPNVLGSDCDFSPDGFKLLQGSRSGLGLPTFVQALINPTSFCSPKGDELVVNGDFSDNNSTFDSELFKLEKSNFDGFQNPGNYIISDKNPNDPENIINNCLLFKNNNQMLHFHTKTGKNLIYKISVDVKKDEEYLINFKFIPLIDKQYNGLSIFIDGENVSPEFAFFEGFCKTKTYTYSWFSKSDKRIDITIYKDSFSPEMFSFDDISFKSCACPAIQSLSAEKVICFGGSVELKGLDNPRYKNSWSPNINISDINIPNPIVNPNKTSTYILTITDLENGCKYIDSVLVVVKPIMEVSIKGTNILCLGDSTLFEIDSDEFVEIKWSTGQVGKTIVIDSPGMYEVTAIDKDGCVYKGAKEVFLADAPVITINGPKEVCIDEVFNLTIDKDGNSYLWSDGQITKTGKFKGPGKYSVRMFISENCFSEDSIEVALKPDGIIDILGSNKICKGQSIVLYLDGEFSSVEWSNGDKDDKTTVSEEGTYSVVVIDKNGCRYTGSKQVVFVDGPEIDIVGPTSVCSLEKFDLSVDEDDATYLWSDGQDSKKASFAGPGKYKVQVFFDNGCISEDSIEVALKPDGIIDILGSNRLCKGQSIVLQVDGEFTTVEWNNGSNDNQITVSDEGIYSVVVIDNNGCRYTGSKQVNLVDSPEINISGPATVCSKEKFNLYVDIDASSYLWSDGQVSKSASFSGPGKYKVQVVFDDGCVSEDSITVLQSTDLPLEVGGSEFLCIGMDAILNIEGDFEEILWSNGSTSNTTNISEEGIYSVSAIDKNGCKYFGNKTITSFDPLSINNTQWDLGSFCVSEKLTLNKIINTKALSNVEIKNIYNKGNKNGLQILQFYEFPFILEPGQLISFKIDLNAKGKVGQFYDTLFIEVGYPCPTFYKIPVTGFIKETQSNIWVVDTLVSVGSYICLPIYANLLCEGFKSGENAYTFELDVNKLVFMPEKVESGNMISENLDNGFIRIKIRDTAMIQAGNNIINYICGRVLLSDSIHNSLIINKMEWEGLEDIQVTKRHGSIGIDQCEFGLRHIDLIKVTNMKSKPNISDGNFVLEIVSSEVGTYNIQILDYTGNILKTISFVRENKQAPEVNQINIIADDLPQGIYFIKLISPWSIKTEKIVIIK